MNPWQMVWRSLRHHALSTVVTAFGIALAGGLLMAVWVVKDQARAVFTQTDGGFDAVLGPRSSPLQLVLNSVFHLENSPGNLTQADYEEAGRQPGVAVAVPLAVGDSFRGFRVVGTTLDLFQKVEYVPGRRLEPHAPGRLFDPARREAVVGSFAAQRLGLRYGDSFHPSHGLQRQGDHDHEETYVVVGILKPSNTPADRVIWIPLAGLQRMSGHAQETMTEVSAVLLKLRAPMAGKALEQIYNKQGTRLTLAWPIGTIMAQLLDRIGWMDRVLAAVAGLVGLVAAASILASIYNSMNERRREIAILRALGARRWMVSGVVVTEAATIAGIGAVAGFAVYALILSSAAATLRAQTGVVLVPWDFHPVMIWAPLAMVGLGALAGIFPAVKAYQTDVAEHLTPH